MWSSFFITTTSKEAAVVFHNPGKGAEMDLSTLKNVKTEAVVHAAQVRNQTATGTGVLRPSTVWNHKGAGMVLNS